MTDDRGRPLSSDDLLREARRRVLEGDLYSDDEPEVPRDDLPTSHGRADADPALDGGEGSVDGEDLSAAAIAEALAEAEVEANPVPSAIPESAAAAESSIEPAARGARAGMNSLPDWALDDEPEPASPDPSPPPSAVVAAGSTPLAERIRLLAMEQEQAGTSDTAQQTLQTPPPPHNAERDIWSIPSAEWQSRPDPVRRSTMTTSWFKPVLSLVVFGIFSIGFFVSVFDGRESIEDVAVGDCFDAGDTDEISTVPIIDCSELHTSELFATVYVDTFGSGYPGEDPLYEWINARCEEEFPAYVGEPYADSRYWIEVFMPTAEGWDEGDRVGLCTVVLVDENLEVRPSLGSARGWGERT
jgi:hypothetical protein